MTLARNRFAGDSVRRYAVAFLGAWLAACDVRTVPPAEPDAPPPASGETSDILAQREHMVEQLKSIIHDPRVLAAMGAVPRHEFVQPEYRQHAYDVHHPLPIDENQTISAPDIVAIMTEALQLRGTERVLEIGTGSGYQAAVLGEMVPEVYTVEIRPALAASARERLESLKSRGLLNYRKIEVIVGDGYLGYPEAQPYDAIIVTAAPKRFPPELLNQVKKGGRIVIPVGEFYQQLQVIEKLENGELSEKPIVPVRFVPMVHEETADLDR